MRIIHLIFDLSLGGKEALLVDIANEQVKKHKIIIVILNKSIDDYLINRIDERIKVIKINRKEKSRSIIPFITLNYHLFRNRPHVIHCHNYYAIRMILLRSNVIFTSHSLNVPTKYLNKYKKVVAISNAVKNDIERRCSVRSILIYNGVDFNKIKARTNYIFSVFKIVQVSRLEHLRKGQHILLKSLRLLVSEKGITNICIDFIGEGESLDYLKGIVGEFNLHKYVNFLGARKRSFVHEHLKDYNMLAQPSIIEGFGLTVAEGMAAKIPVLVSNIDGPTEIVGNGKFGWVFKAGDENDCANTIVDIMHNYGGIYFKNKIESAASYARSKFSICNTAEQYLTEYHT